MNLQYEHLVGLPYEYGVTDCFQLMRRFYADNWNIEITNYAYPDRWWDTVPEEDFFTRLAPQEGFQHVGSESSTMMRPGYCLTIANGTMVASHCGVWIGSGMFLHHPYQEASRIERWVGRWAARTLGVWRHPAALVPETTERVNIIDLMPAHKREKYREILATRVAQS